MSKLPAAVRRHPAVRAVGLPVYQFARRRQAGTPPRVLANSLPKAGTHLLTTLLDQLPDMAYSGVHVTAHDQHRGGQGRRGLAARLDRVRDGQYVSAHLPAQPPILATVAGLGYRCVFIVRDPRDAAVSDVHYILGFARHPLHKRFAAMADMGERLTAVIGGLPDTAHGLPLMEPMAQRLDDYLGWLDASGALAVRFEDLIGPSGGGDAARQLDNVRAVAQHVDRPLSEREAGEVATAIWSPRSSTFRRGASGEWREHFAPDHVDLVKATANAALVRLGYETGDRW